MRTVLSAINITFTFICHFNDGHSGKDGMVCNAK